MERRGTVVNDNINEVPGSSPNLRTELARQLQELVPEVIADGKVDVAKLKELLDDDVQDESERFGLFWPGKKRALRAAQEPTTATLKPMKTDSKDWDTTQNVFIEGDNLEVLKILQKRYHNQIKMIYIDPPYNTGHDFVYPDNYKEGLQSYLEFTQQVDASGSKLNTNSDTDGRYHSRWLNMMYPRLKLARNLLADDGVIFVSIDDHEDAHLRMLMDEVFGAGNFVAEFIWQHSVQPKGYTNTVSLHHNLILCYRRTVAFALHALERTDEHNLNYRNPDADPRGPWRAGDVRNSLLRPNLKYQIETPNGKIIQPPDNGWRWSRETMATKTATGEIIFSPDETKIIRKIYLDTVEGRAVESIWYGKEVGVTRDAARELKELFCGALPFDTPKPVNLINRMLQVAGVSGTDLVLDFFSGSGTTAHAVMEMNALDGENRRHIQVQLPEPTGEDSEARGCGFTTIAEISRKRIDLAGEKIRSEIEGQLGDREAPLDIGYRAYQLADTNFTKWRLSNDMTLDALEQRLLTLRDSSDDAATPDELLIEILLKQGFGLAERITELEVSGLKLVSIGGGALLAYLDEYRKPSLDQLRTIAELEPAKFIILEDAFQGDDELKTNLKQICKTKQIELWTA
jgi:adenine-specific DNA-methyltransferase